MHSPRRGVVVRHNDALAQGVDEYNAGHLDLEEFLALFEPQWQRMAHQMMVRFHLDGDMRDEVISCVREQAWILVTNPPASMSAHQFGGLVVHRTQLALFKILRSRSSPLSGTNKIAERRSGLARTRAVMVETLGYEPLDQDVIETYNAETLARNPRAARQGALARPSDLSPDALGSVTSVDSVATAHGMSSGEAFDILSPRSVAHDPASGIELGSVLRAAIDRLDSIQRDIVTAYLEHTATYDKAPSTTRLVRDTGASRDDVMRAVIDFKNHLITELDEAVSS